MPGESMAGDSMGREADSSKEDRRRRHKLGPEREMSAPNDSPRVIEGSVVSGDRSTAGTGNVNADDQTGHERFRCAGCGECVAG